MTYLKGLSTNHQIHNQVYISSNSQLTHQMLYEYLIIGGFHSKDTNIKELLN